MNFIGLIYLLVAHYFCGRAVLSWFRLELPPVAKSCLSFMIGVPVLSLAPCILQLLHIPITEMAIIVAILVMTISACVSLLLHNKRPWVRGIKLPAIYEWPYMVIIFLVMAVSAWRCFYYPPTARDMLTGPELLAEYTIREKTMINSVFTVDLSTTNDYFKSPYITGLQIIYKLLVSSFGQLWLSVLSFSFTAWLYTLLRTRVHPVIAGLLLLVFTAVPELYAYTYLILYDYSNMVFFFGGFYFLSRFFSGNRYNDFIFSAFLFGLATYIRTETLVLIVMLVPLSVFYFYRKRLSLSKALVRLGIFLAIPVAFYVLCIHVFVRAFVPVPFDVASQVNPHLSNVAPFFHRLVDMAKDLIFCNYGVALYGYFIFFFLLLLLVDIALLRRFKQEALIALYGVAVVYVGLAFLGYLLPLVDLFNTTKRGLFKILPLMLLYMANSNALIWLSGKLRQWFA